MISITSTFAYSRVFARCLLVLIFVTLTSEAESIDEGRLCGLAWLARASRWPDAGAGKRCGKWIPTIMCLSFIELDVSGLMNLSRKNPIEAATLIVFDGETGEMIAEWGRNMFVMPHGLSIDKADNVWVTDVGRHQVFKLSHDGELLLTLGEDRIPGADSKHFKLAHGCSSTRRRWLLCQ